MRSASCPSISAICRSSHRRWASRSRRTRDGTVPVSRFCSIVLRPTSCAAGPAGHRARGSPRRAGRGLGLHGHAEGGQDRRVDRIGLGQAAGGLGEVAGLAGVDHGHRQPGGGQGGGAEDFEPAGGLEHDQVDRLLPQSAEELVEALAVFGTWKGGCWPMATSSLALETSMPTYWERSGAAFKMRDSVRGEECRRRPSLLCGPEGRSTVRAEGRREGRGGDPSSPAACDDLRGDGLPPRVPLL